MLRNNLLGDRRDFEDNFQGRHVKRKGLKVMRNFYSATSNISFFLEHMYMQKLLLKCHNFHLLIQRHSLSKLTKHHFIRTSQDYKIEN